MTHVSLAMVGHGRHWARDVLAGGAMALAAMAAMQGDFSARADQISFTLAPRPAPIAPPPAPAETTPAPAFRFGEPVPGYPVISPFGLRRLPWEAHGRLHEGVDIAAPTGRAVLAIADGVVTRAGRDGAYGRFVEVRHAEGLVSFYAHLGRIDRAIQPGLALKAGARVGQIGSTGVSTGPHLHFEIRSKAGKPLNPEAFIGQEFATADDLPLKTASRFSRRVRLAHVSFIPESKRELMEDKAAKAKSGAEPEMDADKSQRAQRPERPQVPQELAMAPLAPPAPPPPAPHLSPSAAAVAGVDAAAVEHEPPPPPRRERVVIGDDGRVYGAVELGG